MTQEVETPTREYLAELRRNITDCFSDGELRTLCFEMEVDYDSLPGEGKEDKARELVAYFGSATQVMLRCSDK